MRAAAQNQEDQADGKAQVHASTARAQRRLVLVDEEGSIGQLMAQRVADDAGLFPQARRRGCDEQADDRSRYPDE
jgi:hypothetical protein